MISSELLQKYISFFEKKGHKRIPSAPLVPENDPSTLFISSGMQPLIPYLLGESHPQGKRLVNVQNCFRAQDIDEVGDNRHTTFFRMLGNWSLGDYFKKEQLPWFFEFLTQDLKIDPKKLYVSVFSGFDNIPKDEESKEVWKSLFESVGLDPKERIFYFGADHAWWSRSGVPKNMPTGEIGGPDSEVFYDFGDENIHKNSKFSNKQCNVYCDCGRYLEIGNSVFIQYQKQEDESFCELPQKNVDFGGGLERILAVLEEKQDIFQTSLFSPIIQTSEKLTGKEYRKHQQKMRIIVDHFVASVFMVANDVIPSNKEQGYILRRLLRRGFDSFYELDGKEITSVIESIVNQYKETDDYLVGKFEDIKLTILSEEENYNQTRERAKKFIEKKYKGQKVGDELMGVKEISSEDAFILYSTHGLSPTQIKSLGYEFNEQDFAQKMEEHQKISRKGAEQKFAGGLADHSEEVIKGHTATHLLHQALRDVLGDSAHQIGSNITKERLRFDFSFDRKLTEDEIKRVEEIVNQKIKENLPVHFEILDIDQARKIGAIGLFGEKYGDKVKVYFIGGSADSSEGAYSKEFCGGPHVEFTGGLKSFNILKEEGLGRGKRRIYAKLS